MVRLFDCVLLFEYDAPGFLLNNHMEIYAVSESHGLGLW